MLRLGDLRLPRRFWDKVIPCPPSTCWLWLGSLNTNGYGQWWCANRLHLVHKTTYEALNGLVPTGLELDHKCRSRWCCNPGHLEAVTHAVNMARSLVADNRHDPAVQRARSLARWG